jgi:tetratricopeptide (TPR) repeat protein
LHRYLAIAYAGIGQGDDALREAHEAIQLAPLDKDAFYNGPVGYEVLAQVHTLRGDYDAAIEQLEYLLTLPAGLVSESYLQIAPEYANLRHHPRFQALLAKANSAAS